MYRVFKFSGGLLNTGIFTLPSLQQRSILLLRFRRFNSKNKAPQWGLDLFSGPKVWKVWVQMSSIDWVVDNLAQIDHERAKFSVQCGPNRRRMAQK